MEETWTEGGGNSGAAVNNSGSSFGISTSNFRRVPRKSQSERPKCRVHQLKTSNSQCDSKGWESTISVKWKRPEWKWADLNYYEENDLCVVQPDDEVQLVATVLHHSISAPNLDGSMNYWFNSRYII